MLKLSLANFIRETVNLIFVSNQLGTRHHFRNHVTMFSGHKSVGYSILSIFVAATLFRHRGLNVFHIFGIT